MLGTDGLTAQRERELAAAEAAAQTARRQLTTATKRADVLERRRRLASIRKLALWGRRHCPCRGRWDGVSPGVGDCCRTRVVGCEDDTYIAGLTDGDLPRA